MNSSSYALFLLIAIVAIFGETSAFAPSSRLTASTCQPTLENASQKNMPVQGQYSNMHLFARLDDTDEDVSTTLINVDATTLTVVGFGAIAFNFLVLANMGDVGIGGLVARIINTFG